jgi:hypothetical protein
VAELYWDGSIVAGQTPPVGIVGKGHWVFYPGKDQLPNMTIEFKDGHWQVAGHIMDDLSKIGAVWVPEAGVPEADEESELFEPGPEDLDTTDYASSFVPFWAPDSIPALSNHWWVRYIWRLRRRTIRARVADVFYGVATRLDYRREND